MESAETPVRLRLILGKFKVVQVKTVPLLNHGDQEVIIDIMNGVTVNVIVPKIADVREGDLLTFFTEVVTHAKPFESSVQ